MKFLNVFTKLLGVSLLCFSSLALASPITMWTNDAGQTEGWFLEDAIPIPAFAGGGFLTAQHGSFFASADRFYAGESYSGSNGTAVLSQMIDLNSFSNSVDIGGVDLNLSVYFASSAGEDDAIVEIEFFDSTANSLGLFNSGDLGIRGVFDWTLFEQTILVPVTARTFDFRLLAQRRAFTSTNVYFDNVSAALNINGNVQSLRVQNHSLEVPEPSMVFLLIIGLGGLALRANSGRKYSF